MKQFIYFILFLMLMPGYVYGQGPQKAVTVNPNSPSTLQYPTPAQLRTAAGVVIGTNVQAFDADLTTYAGITPSANVQSLLGAADYSAMRTQLSLVVGTNVQAFNAKLSDISGLSLGAPQANQIIYWDGANFQNITFSLYLDEVIGGVDDRFLYRTGGSWTALQLSNSINAGVPNGAGTKVHWSQLLGVPAGFADGTDDGAGGATTINDLGDATADGSVAQGAHEMDFTSTIDAAGESIWTITNTTADAANDVSFLDLKHNDADDANVIYMRMIGDADGTPETDFEFAQDGAIFTKDLTVPTEAYDATGWNGDLTVPTKDAVRDKIESLSLAFDIDALTGTTAAALDSDDVIVISVDGTELKLPMSELELWIESLTLDLGTVNFTTLNTDVFNIFDNVDQSHSLSLVANENLAANINLNLDLDGATRSLNIQGDVVLPAGTALVNGGALGTPSSGTVTNLTGTASININGTVGATTPTTGAFTSVNVSGLTASQAVVTDGSKNLASVAYTGSGNVMRTRTGVIRTIYVNAGAMIARTTNGASSSGFPVETGTNDIMYDAFAFDSATEEGVGFWLTLPAWDAGTVTVKVHWTAAGGSAAETVEWDVAARCFVDDDAIDQALGTEQETSDALIATGDIHITATTPAITVGGTPTANRPIYFQITRDIADDNLAADALLLGATVEFTESATEPSAQ